MVFTCSGLNQMSEPWVAVDETSRHVGMARDTSFSWIDARGLAVHRVGWLWKFKLSEVDACVQCGGIGDEGGATRYSPKMGHK